VFPRVLTAEKVSPTSLIKKFAKIISIPKTFKNQNIQIKAIAYGYVDRKSSVLLSLSLSSLSFQYE
jgi:hypothetical protein